MRSKNLCHHTHIAYLCNRQQNETTMDIKATTVMCIAMLISTASLADIKQIELQNDYETNGKPKPSVSTPTVTYDEEKVSLKTTSLYIPAHITITGTQGNIMYSGTTVLTPNAQTISVPNTDYEEKYKIEITTTQQRLYGYFM